MDAYKTHAQLLAEAEAQEAFATQLRRAGFEAAPVTDEPEISNGAAWMLIAAACLVAAAACIALGLPVGVK